MTAAVVDAAPRHVEDELAGGTLWLRRRDAAAGLVVWSHSRRARGGSRRRLTALRAVWLKARIARRLGVPVRRAVALGDDIWLAYTAAARLAVVAGSVRAGQPVPAQVGDR